MRLYLYTHRSLSVSHETTKFDELQKHFVVFFLIIFFDFEKHPVGVAAFRLRHASGIIVATLVHIVHAGNRRRVRASRACFRPPIVEIDELTFMPIVDSVFLGCDLTHVLQIGPFHFFTKGVENTMENSRFELMSPFLRQRTRHAVGTTIEAVVEPPVKSSDATRGPLRYEDRELPEIVREENTDGLLCPRVGLPSLPFLKGLRPTGRNPTYKVADEFFLVGMIPKLFETFSHRLNSNQSMSRG